MRTLARGVPVSLNNIFLGEGVKRERLAGHGDDQIVCERIGKTPKECRPETALYIPEGGPWVCLGFYWDGERSLPARGNGQTEADSRDRLQRGAELYGRFRWWVERPRCEKW